MNCSPTLTAEEFKVLHNSLCELSYLNDPKVQVLVERIREVALKGAYEQDDRAYTRKHTHYESVRKELGLDAIWSMHEVDDLNKPHPFEGVTHVEYRSHWGPKPIRRQIVGTTWSALYMAANACIRDSGDDHHVFIENLTQEDGALILSTGS